MVRRSLGGAPVIFKLALPLWLRPDQAPEASPHPPRSAADAVELPSHYSRQFHVQSPVSSLVAQIRSSQKAKGCKGAHTFFWFYQATSEFVAGLSELLHRPAASGLGWRQLNVQQTR